MLDHRQYHLYTYIKKSSEPSKEHLGSPALASAQEENFPLSTNLFFLFVKKLGNRFKMLPDNPFCFSFKIMPSCHSLSKALDMFRNTLWMSKPSSND